MVATVFISEASPATVLTSTEHKSTAFRSHLAQSALAFELLGNLMSFLLYAATMSCFLAVADFAHRFSAQRRQRPYDYPPGFSITTVCLTTPSVIGVWAFPVYAFFQMPWWQPIAGFVAAGVVAGVNRALIGGSLWENLWAISVSLTGAGLAIYSIAFQ